MVRSKFCEHVCPAVGQVRVWAVVFAQSDFCATRLSIVVNTDPSPYNTRCSGLEYNLAQKSFAKLLA